MNSSNLSYPLIRRRDTIIDETAMQNLFSHEHIWSNAFRKKKRSQYHPRSSRIHRMMKLLQFLYEKSRVHYLFPIILLFAYSLLGGLIFWSIERPHEELLLTDKRNYISTLTEDLVQVIMSIHHRLIEFNVNYMNNSTLLRIHHRGYRKYALNKIHKSVYWYTLSTFYLTEHEMHKVMALRPRNPEQQWKKHFESNFGRIKALKNYTDQLCLRCWELGVEGAYRGWSKYDYSMKVNETVAEYNKSVGLEHVLTPVWTFWNSMFLAVTTYTTIGYGNITAKTKLGKLAAMVYALFGIPLVLMILHKLGRFFLLAFEHVWDMILRFSARSGSSRVKVSGEERIAEMPLLLALGVAFGWMFLCAAIFLKFEKDWDYFKSFYFFFCSLTTIGYGDVTPTNSEDMFLIFGLIIIGLSLVSMCINVIQLKLEKLFEELLLTMMEEFNQDPESSRKMERIGMMEMWRAWKKHKGRLGNGLQTAKTAKDVANKAGENFAKLLPFSRRRQRLHLIEELQKRMMTKNKQTQTDWGELGYDRSCTDVSDVDSVFTSGANTCHVLLIPDGPVCGPSRCQSQPVVAEGESDDVFSIGSSTQLPLSLTSSQHQEPSTIWSTSSASGPSSHGAASVRSAPVASPSRFPIDFDPNRRWTFVGSNRTSRGPRGLVVPYMYTKPMASAVHTNEVSRLIAEIEARIEQCRVINTPEPSIHGSVSGSLPSRSNPNDS